MNMQYMMERVIKMNESANTYIQYTVRYDIAGRTLDSVYGEYKSWATHNSREIAEPEMLARVIEMTHKLLLMRVHDKEVFVTEEGMTIQWLLLP